MENKNTGLAVQQPASVFASTEAFEQAQRMAVALSKSTIVPKEFQNNPANTLIALEYANRIGESPMIVMQNLNVINGRPGLKAEYLIQRINTCGRYKGQLEFEYTGEGETLTCVAYATRQDGKLVKGNPVSIKMAKAEGWYNRSGSKWPNMPHQMLAYRATSFFQRLHCPDLTFGMQTVDEVIDITAEVVSSETKKSVNDINERIQQAKQNPRPLTPEEEAQKLPKNVTLTDAPPPNDALV